MAVRRDAGLAVLALAVFLAAFVFTAASLSIPALVVGGVGTIGFELVAVQYAASVRRVWERSAVQAVALVGAVAIAVFGALTAPAIVLSAGIGALVTYLLVLAIVLVVR